MPYISFLTSSFANVGLYGLQMCKANRLFDKLRPVWKANSKILVISARPDQHSLNEHIPKEVEDLFDGELSFSSIELCDSRNPDIMERIKEMDVLFLLGGSPSKQNALIQSGKLKEKLAEFNGIVIGWSAGSMNCAEYMYPIPEVEGETIHPEEGSEKCLPGLGILHGVGILPHFESKYWDLEPVQGPILAQYFEHDIIGLVDGSWILVDGDTATLFGEAFRIKDGEIVCICHNGESFELYSKHEE